MNRQSLEKAVAQLGLTVEEAIIPQRCIDIMISAPSRKRFRGCGVHTLVTHWQSDYPEARAAAIDDARSNLPLEECTDPGCDCREEG